MPSFVPRLGARLGARLGRLGRLLACALLACASVVAPAGVAVGGVGTTGLQVLLVDQVATPPAPGSVTYTPMRRPGATPVPTAAPSPVHGQTAAPVLVPVAPGYVPPSVAPTYAPAASAMPLHTVPSPLPLPPAPPTGLAQSQGASVVPAPVVSAKALRPAKQAHRVLGLASDVGMPDGLNLGLVLSPADWLRLGASIGTNSASLNYRGGLSLVPMGWGPSFTAEVGHCNTAPTTSLVRTFFTVPSWVQPYVQQLGYTYVNAHVGFDYRWGGLTLFVHGGYTYLMGTIRSPNPVVVDSKTNTSIQITQDGSVTAYTLSAKAGFVYMFGGP